MGADSIRQVLSDALARTGHMPLTCVDEPEQAACTQARPADTEEAPPTTAITTTRLQVARPIGVAASLASINQDIIAYVAQDGPESTNQGQDDAGPGESFSRFVTRILDQLSISSWLPAIMLICNLALILQLRSQHNFDLGDAIRVLTAKPLGILIVLILSIVVTSIVTQAFEFQAIRLLEGYWGSIRILSGLSELRTRRHVSRLKRLRKRYNDYLRRAFSEARERMLDENVPREIIEILDKQRRGEPLDGEDRALVARAERVGWRRYAHPELLRRMDAAESMILEYPQPHRILPTTLGNTLRSREDQLSREPHENLEEFVLRRYEQMTPELKIQHRRFRSQLNIYCLLTFIFLGLAVVSEATLVRSRADLVGSAAFVAVYAALSFVSYRAAIAAASGYVSVLGVIGTRSRD
jgi:hypothetical protein